MRVQRLERQCAATVAPPVECFDPVVIYNLADGVPDWPANAPPEAACFFLPGNGRDRPEPDELTETPVPVEPTTED
jgi:hypothetical protein